MNIPEVRALIPLKAHSERIPNKNMRLLCGRPLFHWIVEALARSKYITDIVIDTDSAEIARNAHNHFQVTVLMRPKELHGDFVGINPLINFQLSQVSGEFFLQTHSTNPLLKPSTIDNAVETFFGRKGHDSLFAVNQWQARFYWEDGRPINHDPKNMLRTQDLAPIFQENSNLYIFSRASFHENNHRIGAKPIMFPMDVLEAVDIDNEEDLVLAERLMSLRINNG